MTIPSFWQNTRIAKLAQNESCVTEQQWREKNKKENNQRGIERDKKNTNETRWYTDLVLLAIFLHATITLAEIAGP